MTEFLKYVVILSSLAGFLLSFYIYKKKRHQEALVCPIGSDCNNVVNSDYSKFFGIPLELIGIIYYGVIFVSYLIISTTTLFVSPSAAFSLIIVSTAAFFFSLYLTTIQGVVLKEWCTWCLTSALLSTLIFLSSLGASDWSFLDLLYQHQGLIFLIHLIGIALGIGAATIGDIFFLRFLKDLKISITESEILKAFGQILWLALGVVTITSWGIYLPNANIAFSSPQFVIEMLVILAIVLNAVYLTLIVYPRFVMLSFDREKYESLSQDRGKKLAFASGAISIASWYTLLFLVSPMPINLSTPRLAMVYIGIVLVAIGLSQIIHDRYELKAKKLGY